MSQDMRVLIVEDDATERETWKALVELKNSENDELKIDTKFARSAQEAVALLESQRFDAAVVDIRLEQDGVSGANADGNIVISQIEQSGLIVVAAFTGEQRLVESPTVKSFVKGNAEAGEGTEAVLDWLAEQAPMVAEIRATVSLVQRSAARLFHASVWPRWRRWAESGQSVTLPLARHLTSHVHAALLEEQDQRVHPEEWYFVPPIRPGIRTGDIIKLRDDAFAIVVSPRCDLAPHSRVTHILLARCTSVVEEWAKLDLALKTALDNSTATTPGEYDQKGKKQKDALRKFTQHDGNKSYLHFLPKAWLKDGSEFGPVYVNFDQLRSIAKDSRLGRCLTSRRVATVAPEFLPSVVERLGAYLSRIGTPDYSHPE